VAAHEISARMKSAIITKADAYKNMVKQLFIGGALWLFEKKIWYTCGFDLGDALIFEFMILIPRPLSTSNLICYLWINIPYNESGAAKLKEIYKRLREKVDKPPLTEKDWKGLEPIRNKLAEAGIEGANIDLWPTIIAED